MKRLFRYMVATLLALVVASGVGRAQFHSNGQSPASHRWRTLADGEVRVVAPDFAEESARRLLFYMDSLTHTIGYGLGKGGVVPLRMPVVLHSASSASNGITIMAPRRIEIATMPAASSYSTTWLRQLSVHEYRHAAQYAALFGGSARWAYYLLGDQALLAATGVMPFWWLEGDAVDAETQSSLFGRALQPSFTMHYRAVGRKVLEGNSDVWFSGSYNRYTPSHYELGYQMVTAANTLAGRYVWGEIMDYAARWPITITPFEWAMRRNLGITTKGLFTTTFERLNDLWDSLPKREEGSTPLPAKPTKSPYRTDLYPLWSGPSTIVVARSDFDTPMRLVEVDCQSGRQRTITPTGTISSRPAIIGDYIYWTEMQQLSSYSQEIGSVMMRRHLRGRGLGRRTLAKSTYALYPTDYCGSLAYVRYNLEGTYSVVCPEGEITLEEGVECHGLAAADGILYLLTTGYGGMAIVAYNPATGDLTTLKEPSYTTLSHLSASADGRYLYFGSIASGYDEIHRIEIATKQEQRITSSRYGSFYGAPSPDGNHLALSSYDASGYRLATAPIVNREVVAQSRLPRNVVNPEVYKWSEVVCIDSLRFTAAESADSHAHIPSRPYRKWANLIDFHSWAPLYYRPEEFMAGNLRNITFGLTATSQSLLSDALTTAGLYMLPSGNYGAAVNFKYLGIAPKFELNAMVDSRSAAGYPPKGTLMKDGYYYASYDHTESAPSVPQTRSNYSLYGRIYLPVVLSNSYVTSVLTPSLELSHSNRQVYSPSSEHYFNGLSVVGATLQWTNYTRSAYRDLQPRWGVTVAGGVAKALAAIETPLTVGAFVRGYLPGFGANDGFTVEGFWQDICGDGPLSTALGLGWLQPRGLRTVIYPDENVAASLQYNTPLWYPDRGIEGIVLIKRLSLSLFADGIVGRLWTEDRGVRMMDGTVTFGANLTVDSSWLRLPEQGDLTFRAGIYFDARDLAHPTPSFGMNLNF